MTIPSFDRPTDFRTKLFGDRLFSVLYAASFVLAFLFSTQIMADEIVTFSPNGLVAARLVFENGTVSLRIDRVNETVVSCSNIGLTFDPVLEDGAVLVGSSTSEVETERIPVWGENASIRDVYRGVVAGLRERGGTKREFQLETRVYNEGVAFRFLLPKSEQDWVVLNETTEFTFDQSCDSWPLTWTEATYPQAPVKIKDVKGDVYPPLTLRSPSGTFLAVFEGSGDDYPRSVLNVQNGKTAFRMLGRARLSGAQERSTLWRVVSIAADERELVANESWIYNLARPTELQDVSWLNVGKTISNEGNCDINTEKLKSMVDFASLCGMKYVQIDWGWYGTEWRWSKEEQDKWAETNPERADDPDWRRNCEADPFSVAKGLVPYLPTWKSCTWVDLDLPELVRYGKEKGVGICLYVNDKMLKANDLEKLFSEYERWGLAGLKPGFVRYGEQEDERAIEDMIAIAARHKLWLCVHDSYLSNGFSRTYPNLYSVEGGGGQEGGHPAHHDVTLPFGRCLAGPFDYTPALYCKGKSHAHQLSLLTTIYNPAPVIRGGWGIRDAKADGGYGAAFGDEIEFLKRVPTDWTKTCVLDAKIGERLAVARQGKDGVWYLGVTNGEEEVERELPLNFLDQGKKYRLSLWRDSDEERDGWRPTVFETRNVDYLTVLNVVLKPSGGAVAIFEEIADEK